MCAIIGWSGKLPKGLLTSMLLQAEKRGHDSTGIAYRLDGQNKSVREAVPASKFVSGRENSSLLSQARRSLRGIAHTRRASPNMPVDHRNAHPFPFWRYFFAHNGRIVNWPDVKETLIDHYTMELNGADINNDVERIKTARYCLEYCQGKLVDGAYIGGITTDSMVIGPYINGRDFSSLVGCMGLAWMIKNQVYVFRYAKEVVGVNIIWQGSEDKQCHLLTLAASTYEIIYESLSRVDGLESHIVEHELTEGVVYRLEPTGFVQEGLALVNAPIEDEFSSETV